MISANNVTVWSIGLLLITSFVAGTAAADESAHIGFADEYAEYSQDSELGENYVPTGDNDAIGQDWKVAQTGDEADQHLQAINQGTGLVLDNGVHLADNRIVNVDVRPIRNTVSNFYRAAVNIAENVVAQLGDVTGNGAVDVVNMDLNSQGPGDETISFNDQTKALPVEVPFNQWTTMTIAVEGDTLSVTVDSPTDKGTVTFENVDVATGTVGFNQPSSNTARVLLDDLNVDDTPAEPANVEAFSGPGMTQVTVDWDAPEKTGGTTLNAYDVYHGTSPDDLSKIATVKPGTTQYTHQTSYTDTNAHYFAVQAVNDVGTSPMSDTACNEVAPLGIAVQDNPVVGCSR